MPGNFIAKLCFFLVESYRLIIFLNTTLLKSQQTFIELEIEIAKISASSISDIDEKKISLVSSRNIENFFI